MSLRYFNMVTNLICFSITLYTASVKISMSIYTIGLVSYFTFDWWLICQFEDLQNLLRPIPIPARPINVMKKRFWPITVSDFDSLLINLLSKLEYFYCMVSMSSLRKYLRISLCNLLKSELSGSKQSAKPHP